MTQQFTASEVRAYIRHYPIPGKAEDMFNAFADLLEAQEKAVPVATCGHSSTVEHRASNANVVGSNPIARSNSDAERLAEALRARIRQLRNMPKGEFQLAASIFADELERIIAAHSAQAQPPVASVPSAVVELPAQWEKLSELDCGNVGCHAKGTLLTCAQELRNALAAQENPNG